MVSGLRWSRVCAKVLIFCSMTQLRAPTVRCSFLLPPFPSFPHLSASFLRPLPVQTHSPDARPINGVVSSACDRIVPTDLPLLMRLPFFYWWVVLVSGIGGVASHLLQQHIFDATPFESDRVAAVGRGPLFRKLAKPLGEGRENVGQRKDADVWHWRTCTALEGRREGDGM